MMKVLMNEGKATTVDELATLVRGRVTGDAGVLIECIASIDSAGPGAVAFVEDQKFLERLQGCSASALIVPEGSAERAHQLADTVPALIETSQPKLAFALIAELLHPQKRREPYVHVSAVIAETADIDLTVYIGPHVAIGEGSRIEAGTRIEAGVVIGDHVRLGRDCVLHPGVVLYDDVTIGDRVLLHAGVCIGADGFGYVRDDMGYHKFPQRGTVVIEDDVELGAHTCVDRAALGQTRIGRASCRERV